ncbi:sugar phosphate isomerase/epimerase family protein [Sphingobium boeckii]|uniref:D-psicose/D-tagatose/L-ribulose 3-epimerase n=1 Tax=Sphingobium boeckii TaxID=1082345 RepID=A0A7W9EFE9_9SPHN|nr:sugar phosphate isomerase/epimerase family protein [Sphingobium boeckii]MBB5685970.1 D-psicose/D-tagatose/L-ribulose 3-epimerase [Sphingobium boeckii]
MKIGINMLLWTGHVTEEHIPILQALKDTGFDGVEVPVFDVGDPAHYRWLGGVLDDIGLQRTVVAIIPDAAHSPISPDAADRARAMDHLRRVIDCSAALGGTVLAGPWFQALGVFTGERPSETELEHCAEIHRKIVPEAYAAGITAALEPLNRFEAHLLNTCEQAIAYAARVAEPGFGILYDTFHANIEERDPIAALHALHASGALTHVHISENDRGTPGRGHAKIRETIAALKALGYDDWLTIEAFGRGVPELAAATRVWRDFFADPREVYTEGHGLIRECWDQAQ